MALPYSAPVHSMEGHMASLVDVLERAKAAVEAQASAVDALAANHQGLHSNRRNGIAVKPKVIRGVGSCASGLKK